MHSLPPEIAWDRTLMRRDQAAKGWTDTDLAREAGVHQTSIGRWFAGKSSNPKLAAKIAAALGFSTRRYLPRTEPASSADDHPVLPFPGAVAR